MADKEQFLRIAFRQEGLYWVAYLAGVNSLKDALVLGSIAMAAAEHPEVKDAFMSTMRMVCEVLSPVGVEYWSDPVRAPESERSSNA